MLDPHSAHATATSTGWRLVCGLAALFPHNLHGSSSSTVLGPCTRIRRRRTTSARCRVLRVRSSCVLPYAGSYPRAAGGTVGAVRLSGLRETIQATTGFANRQKTKERLWQAGYHERILRNDEASPSVARYILENPVRAGLTKAIDEYPFAGSGIYDGEALKTAWDEPDPRQT